MSATRRPARGLRAWVVAAAAALAAAGCPGDSTGKDLRDIEEAYHALRDSILQGADEAFFSMHCRAAREAAVAEFPVIRSRYLASPPEEREAFHALFRVTAEEFLGREPRALVVRMLPWKSGWRDRRELYRAARVKDVRIDRVAMPDGSTERRGVVLLDITGAPGLPAGADIPENYLPTVVFVKDPEGWRRRSFFME